MRHPHRFLIVLALLLPPLYIHASMWDILEGDLKSMDEIQLNDARDDAWSRTEAERESVSDLFPALPVPPKETFEERREERTGQFLSVEIGKRILVFRDVPIKEWFAPYVRTVAESGMMTGYNDAQGMPLGIFHPERPVSIEELAKIVLSTSGSEQETCGSPRNVTASGSWSAAFIACAEQKNFVVYSDGSVDVKRPALRSEVIMTILQRFGIEMNQPNGTVFTDVPTSQLFASAIERAYRDGIVIGYTDTNGTATGTFGPNDAVTRAEIAKMMTQALMVYTQKL